MEKSAVIESTRVASLESLVAAAVKAPSGDNMQPWRFELDHENQTIALILDPTRDPSPMNAGQSMSRLACGAAWENLHIAAARSGLKVEAVAKEKHHLARVRLTESGQRALDLEDPIPKRSTNRRFYDGRPISSEEVQVLKEAVKPEGSGRPGGQEEGGSARAIWSFDADRKKALADLDARATTLMYIQPSMRGAIAENICFDRPADEEVEEGLSLASLELSRPEQVAMKLMFRSPNWLLRYGGGLMALGHHVKRLHLSASGHCLITGGDYGLATDLGVGRVVQRAWLALTELGLAAQPMMSVMVLDGVLAHGDPEYAKAIGRKKIETLTGEFRRIFPELGSDRPAFLLRFGYAPDPSGRTGRLPLQNVITRA